MDDFKKIDTNVNSSLRGSKMTSVSSHETKVSEALSFLGVKADKQVVSQAIGYLSANSMQANISNVETFLNSKSDTKDLRK